MKDYYAVLGVRPDCSGREIKSSFRAHAKNLHPDVLKARNLSAAEAERATESMRQLLEAYRVLSDPERRHTYDFERKKRARISDVDTSFDYRAWLLERQDDPEYQAKLVFYDLLHDRDDEAIDVYERMKVTEDGRLERFFERSEAMDAELCIAELYEDRGRLSDAYAVYRRLIRMELERPSFGYYFEVVIAAFKRLTLEKLPRVLEDDAYLDALADAIMVDPVESDKAAFWKRRAEILLKSGDVAGAAEAYFEARSKAPRLAGLAALGGKLGAH